MNEILLHKKFNKLTVIEELDSGMIKCECECGNVKILKRDVVKSGKTKSCGCMLKSHGAELGNVFDEEVKKYGTNIRLITSKKLSPRNKTGYTGIWYNGKTGKYQVSIGLNGKKKYLGDYHKLDEAIRARQEAEDTYYGPLIQMYNENLSCAAC